MAEQEVDGGPANPNRTFYLRLIHKLRRSSVPEYDASTRFRCYLIDDPEDKDKDVVDLRMKTLKFESPGKAWVGSAMAVVGKFLYLAGGAQLKEFPNPRKVSLEDLSRYEPQSQVYRMDTSRSGSKWTDRGELRMPRDRFQLVPSINCNELYAIFSLFCLACPHVN